MFQFWVLGSIRRKIFQVVDLFNVLYSLFFIRYYFFWVLTCSRSPASITICFSSEFWVQYGGKSSRWSICLMLFIPCSLFDIIFSVFWHVVDLLRRSLHVSVLCSEFCVLSSEFNTEENHPGVDCLLFFILCSLFDIVLCFLERGNKTLEVGSRK